MTKRREEIQARWPTLLPSPETLAEYNAIVPGIAERILSTTERTVTSKIDTANKLADAEIRAARISLSLTISLALLAFAACVTFFATHRQVLGIAFACLLFILLIRLFLVAPIGTSRKSYSPIYHGANLPARLAKMSARRRITDMLQSLASPPDRLELV